MVMQESLQAYCNQEEPVHATQRNKILNILQTQGYIYTSMARQIAYQYNARIYELRRLGYNIYSININGNCGFVLK